MIKLEEKLKQLQANCYMLQLYMETRSKTFSDNFWSFGWPWLGTHVYKMTPTAFDYHSISYGAHAQCAPFDTVRITTIRRTNRRFSVKLANNREEGAIYRSEGVALFICTLYGMQHAGVMHFIKIMRPLVCTPLA
ncbi:hypothetical protein TNCV_861731 [Trichonephila clavipes]|nr:hypothetical protein TNCV_861731 [Trichonephila clavipes]